MIEHQLRLARSFGIEEAIVLTGHGSEAVQEFVGDGDRFGLRVTCRREETPLGTAGAFAQLGSLWNDTLLVIYGDLACNFDIDRFITYHRAKGGAATLFAHPNDHPFDSDLLETDEQHRIIAIHRKPHATDQWLGNFVNAAAYMIEPSVSEVFSPGPFDWAKDVFPRALAADIPLFAYKSSEYLKDMGTPQRLEEVRRDYEIGLIANGSYASKRPAIFLDRDGTINRGVSYCHRPEDFELLPAAAKAIGRVNRSGFLAIVITNQSVVARGLCTLAEVERIHRKMVSLLGQEGAYLDDIYFCPHHPDRGFAGENPAFKIACDCRKPKPGLVYQAAADHNIDLCHSWMVGDSNRDIVMGAEANLKTVYVSADGAMLDGTEAPTADHWSPNLGAAIETILSGRAA